MRRIREERVKDVSVCCFEPACERKVEPSVKIKTKK